MKKLLLAIMLIISMSAKSQFSIDIGSGYDLGSKHVPIDVNLTYTYKRVVANANVLRFDATFDGEKNDYFGGGIGYNVVDSKILVTPSVGYYFNLISLDIAKGQNPNKWYPGYFLDLSTNRDKKLNLYLEVGYVATTQITFGVTFQP